MVIIDSVVLKEYNIVHEVKRMKTVQLKKMSRWDIFVIKTSFVHMEVCIAYNFFKLLDNSATW